MVRFVWTVVCILLSSSAFAADTSSKPLPVDTQPNVAFAHRILDTFNKGHSDWEFRDDDGSYVDEVCDWIATKKTPTFISAIRTINLVLTSLTLSADRQDFLVDCREQIFLGHFSEERPGQQAKLTTPPILVSLVAESAMIDLSKVLSPSQRIYAIQRRIVTRVFADARTETDPQPIPDAAAMIAAFSGWTKSHKVPEVAAAFDALREGAMLDVQSRSTFGTHWLSADMRATALETERLLAQQPSRPDNVSRLTTALSESATVETAPPEILAAAIAIAMRESPKDALFVAALGNLAQ